MLKTTKKFELHYYFNDNSHSMNALVRNECEKEILLIFKELITSLDIEVEIESEAFLEGGLKEWWKLLGKNSPQITLLLTVFAIYLSQHPTENKELVKLQIENLKLDNEIKQNELKKISKEIKSEDEVSDELVYRVLEKLNNDYKLLWYKSNFYRKLNLYDIKFVEKQKEMIKDAYHTFRNLRNIFQQHRYAKSFIVPEWLENGKIGTY